MSVVICVFNSTAFEDQKWDPYNDICAVKAFQRTKNAVKKVRQLQRFPVKLPVPLLYLFAQIRRGTAPTLRI